MRRIIVVLGLLSAPLAARGQETCQTGEAGLYYQTLLAPDSLGRPEWTHRGFFEGWTQISEKFGTWGFSFVEAGYVSALGGLSYAPIQFGECSVLEFGLSAGFEAERPEESEAFQRFNRYGGYVYLGDERRFAEYYTEFGSSGTEWTRITVNLGLSKNFALGGFCQLGSESDATDGCGPRLTFTGKKMFTYSAWFSPMLWLGDKGFLFGGAVAAERRK